MSNPNIDALFVAGGDWVETLAILAGAVLIGLAIHWFLDRLIRRSTRSLEGPLREALLMRLSGPARLLLPLFLAHAALPALPVTTGGLFQGALYAAVVAALAWMAIALLYAAEDAIAQHYATDVPDNLKARKVVTQVRILRRVAAAIIIVLAAGIMLLQYEPVRQIGTGILASAGIVGLVMGIAAQRTLGDLFAGIQIALTQPIRVDDVVIAEGDFGWIEEITLTYVVVRVWDRRRIVLPITHFVEQPFQNWTRTSADLIGTVFLYLDYSVPVDDLRGELQRIVEASEHWDGDVVGLQMTDASERTVTLRALASANDAPTLWNLRCEIREKLVAYIREQYPESLPALRTRIESPGGDGAPNVAGVE